MASTAFAGVHPIQGSMLSAFCSASTLSQPVGTRKCRPTDTLTEYGRPNRPEVVMARRVRAAFVVFGCLVFLPSVAAAQQASITGIVRDASGAVLPGVTVEASSPALIEGVR